MIENFKIDSNEIDKINHINNDDKNFRIQNLNSINSINLDSPTTVIQSDKVLLGDKNARESVILGDKFLADFQSLMSTLISLTAALQTPIGTPIPFVPNVEPGIIILSFTI